MNGNIIKYVADSLSNQDVATQNYVNKNAIATVAGVVSSDIKLNVGSDLVRSLRYNDITVGKKFTLLLGTDTNTIVFRTRYTIFSAYQNKTDGGFLILINQQPICHFSQDVILCSQPIDMDLH